jgi:hypothetical protein
MFSYGIDKIKTSLWDATELLSMPEIVPLMFPNACFAVSEYSLAASDALCASLDPIRMSCLLHQRSANPFPMPPVPPMIPIFNYTTTGNVIIIFMEKFQNPWD